MEDRQSSSNTTKNGQLTNSKSQLSLQFAGNIQCPFKLCIVGGGPSGCSIVLRAIRIGMANELCDFVFEPNHSTKPTPIVNSCSTHNSSTNATASCVDDPVLGGVCIIDRGPVNRFGGGKLQDYLINSNTWANKFVTNVLNDKLDVTPPETVKDTLLEELKGKPNTVNVESYGTKNAPLNEVGAFLSDAGTIVREQLNKYPNSSKCITDTAVQSVYRIEKAGFSGWRVVTTNKELIVSEYYTKYLVLCTGGLQLPPVFPSAAHTHKIMTSDYVCTEKGINELRHKLIKAGRAKVTIVGGSHSAFSAAWMCLNKISFAAPLSNTSTIIYRNAATSTTSGGSCSSGAVATAPPGSPSKTSRNGVTYSVTSNSNNSCSSSISGSSSPSKQSRHNVPATLDSDSAHNTASGNGIAAGGLSFQPSSIVLLHRSPIDVFYATKAEADSDNYTVEPWQIGKVTGQIHPFGGLRGDAKELWRSVRTARESRVRLMQIKHPVATVNIHNNNHNTMSSGGNINGNITKQTLVDKLFDESVVIIWACGYSSNVVPVYDTNGVVIPLKLFRGQVEVDDAACIMAEEHYHLATAGTGEAIIGGGKKVRRKSKQADGGVSDVALGDSDGAGTATAVNDSATQDNKVSNVVIATGGSESDLSIETESLNSAPVTASATPLTSPQASKTKQPNVTAGTPNNNANKTHNQTSSSATTTAANSNSKVIPNLLGSGLGFGFKATLENGELDGSSGRADGVAVYLKRGATLILAKVLGNKVYGGNGNIVSWEQRNKEIRKANTVNIKNNAAEAAAAAAIANNNKINNIIDNINNLCTTDSHEAAAAALAEQHVNKRPHTSSNLTTPNRINNKLTTPTRSITPTNRFTGNGTNNNSNSSNNNNNSSDNNNNSSISSNININNDSGSSSAQRSKSAVRSAAIATSKPTDHGPPLPSPLCLDPNIATSVERLSKPKAAPANSAATAAGSTSNINNSVYGRSKSVIRNSSNVTNTTNNAVKNKTTHSTRYFPEGGDSSGGSESDSSALLKAKAYIQHNNYTAAGDSTGGNSYSGNSGNNNIKTNSQAISSNSGIKNSMSNMNGGVLLSPPHSRGTLPSQSSSSLFHNSDSSGNDNSNDSDSEAPPSYSAPHSTTGRGTAGIATLNTRYSDNNGDKMGAKRSNSGGVFVTNNNNGGGVQTSSSNNSNSNSSSNRSVSANRSRINSNNSGNNTLRSSFINGIADRQHSTTNSSSNSSYSNNKSANATAKSLLSASLNTPLAALLNATTAPNSARKPDFSSSPIKSANKNNAFSSPVLVPAKLSLKLELPDIHNHKNTTTVNEQGSGGNNSSSGGSSNGRVVKSLADKKMEAKIQHYLHQGVHTKTQQAEQTTQPSTQTHLVHGGSGGSGGAIGVRNSTISGARSESITRSTAEKIQNLTEFKNIVIVKSSLGGKTK